MSTFSAKPSGLSASGGAEEFAKCVKPTQNGRLPNNTIFGQKGMGINGFKAHLWLCANEAAKMIGCSRDTIERRGVPWREEAAPHKIRFKLLVLDNGGQARRRYYAPDVEALLFAPNQLPKASRPRLIPKFVKRTAAAVSSLLLLLTATGLIPATAQALRNASLFLTSDACSTMENASRVGAYDIQGECYPVG